MKPTLTQTQRLLAFMKKWGSINPMQAWSQLGIYRLASRINDLKKEGYSIESKRIIVLNCYHEECSVAMYQLRAEATQQELPI